MPCTVKYEVLPILYIFGNHMIYRCGRFVVPFCISQSIASGNVPTFKSAQCRSLLPIDDTWCHVLSYHVSSWWQYTPPYVTWVQLPACAVRGSVVVPLCVHYRGFVGLILKTSLYKAWTRVSLVFLFQRLRPLTRRVTHSPILGENVYLVENTTSTL